ncbi:MAG: SMC-Scp complex subunit ScpB [FCB group bacterium]|nr:SMC-Scp complex subunit ScpB [FCB group bacterium]
MTADHNIEIDYDLEHLCQAIEALLMSSELPLTNQQIRTAIGFGSPEIYLKAVNLLNEEYRKSRRSFEINSIAGGYQIYTLPKFHDYIERLWASRKKTGLTRSGMETLAIIAYRQRITRVEVDEIRGVNSDSVIQGLLERRLIKISGRESSPGRPMIYTTTAEFLRYFGLNSLRDLPRDKDFELEAASQTALFALDSYTEDNGKAGELEEGDDSVSEEVDEAGENDLDTPEIR